MKRFLTGFLLFLCTLMLCSIAFASDSEIVLQEKTHILTSFMELPDPYWPYWKEVVVLDEDEALTADMLPAVMRYEDNEGGYAIRISWNVTDEALSEPGLHYVTGTPNLPADAILAEGFDGIATWPVFRTGDGVRLTVTPEQPEIINQLISQNGDPAAEVRFDIPESRCNVGEDGYIDVSDGVSWQWDFSDVDTSTLGAYPVTGTAILPDWLSLPENYNISFTAYVLPTDRIEIYADTGLVGSRLEIYWLYDSSAVTYAVLELKTDDKWIACDKTWYSFSNSYSPARLSLYPLNIPAETEYTLRLRYMDVIDSETVERYTEPIIMTIPANIAELIENSINKTLLQLGNGDRDGSDSVGSDLPDYQQPAPRPEKDTDPEPEPVQEVVTDTYSAISGLRLEQLVQAGATVLFEKQGVSIEIPSQRLSALCLGKQELLEVTIARPEKYGIQIDVKAAGVPVDDLAGTVVYLPWDASQGTELKCHDIDGIQVEKVHYNESSKTLQFEITKSGTYIITETMKEEPVNEPSPDIAEEPDIYTTMPGVDNTPYIWLVIGAGAVLLLVVILLWRRWRHD